MKQKTLRYLFLSLLFFALPILMLPNSAGAWTYINDGAMPAGIVSGGALLTQGLTYSGAATPSHSAIFGGWTVSYAVANYLTNNVLTVNPYPVCLACHSADSVNDSGTAHDKTSYLLTGHKNVARKVAGTPYAWNTGNGATGFTTSGNYWWGGPTGGPLAPAGQQSYTTDSATSGDAINFITGQLTKGGTASSIYYIGIAGWMDWQPLPGLLTNNYDGSSLCGGCHVTGYGDTSANNPTVTGAGTGLYLTPSQPDASTSAAVAPVFSNGTTKWVLDGVQCTACHDVTPTGTSVFSMGGSPIYENATELCFSCHEGGQTATYVDGTSGATSTNYKPALSMATASNVPNFGLSYGTPANQFFNSPHGRFSGTAGANNQGTRGVWGTYVYTTPGGIKTTIQTQTANEDQDQVWQPGAYSSLFKNSVSGDANQGRNYGCAMACHDPHITTVDAVNTQPMQISCNGYVNTATGAGIGSNGFGGPSPSTVVSLGAIAPVAVYNCHQSTNTLVNNPAGAVTSAGDPLGIDLTQINHPVGVGTPLGTTSGSASQESDACVICHMPRPDNGDYQGNGGTDEVMKLHLFRINTNVNYSTFPAYTDNTNGIIGYNNSGVLQQANTAYDGSPFPGNNAVWVDIDLACGQCHGGGAKQNYTTGTISAGTATLVVPYNIDGSGGSTAGATNAAMTAVNNMKAGDRIRVVGAGISNGLLIAGETGAADQHSIIQKIAVGTTTATITLTENAGTTVTSARVITNPTNNGASYFPKFYLADMAANMHNQSAQVSVATSPLGTVSTVGFTATLNDASTSGANITVNWGDGNLSGNAAVSTGVAGGTFNHTYPSPGKYTVVHTAATGAASSIENIPISVPTSFTLSGTVTNNSSVALVGAIVILKQNGITKKTATSIAGGAYSFSNVPFGTYTISAYDAGYTFTPASITVNANIVHTVAAQ